MNLQLMIISLYKNKNIFLLNKMENITEDNIREIINQPEYLLFYFTAKWCGPCQKIKPMILKLKEGLNTDKIKFYMIDIDDNDELCEKCNVTSVPTFILFKDKKEVGQCKGANIVPVANLIKPYC
jgi:thioredoxin 1